MAVAVDATGTVNSTSTAGTTFNYTGITVGSGSNRALVFLLAISGANTATGATAVWDSGATNQSMTLVKTLNYAGTNHGTLWYFCLRNPTAGLKTLAVSWTGSAGHSACAISFTGVDQSSDANAFPHSNSATAANGTLSMAVTSATGNIPVVLGATGTISAPNQTQIFLDATAPDDAGGQRAAGAASVTFTWTNGSATTWGMVGSDIAATSFGPFSQFSDPVRTRVSPVPWQQYLAYIGAAPFPETVTESRWHQPWSEPYVKTKAGLVVPAHQFIAFPPQQAAPITATVAAADIAGPTFTKTLIYQAITQPVNFPIPASITWDAWTRWPDFATRQKPAVNFQPWSFVVITPGTGNMMWFQAWSWVMKKTMLIGSG